MVDKTTPKAIIISYVPMLKQSLFEAGELIEITHPDSQILKDIDDHQVHVYACLWLYNETNSVCPTFIIDNAQELKDHMTQWAENEPEEWFKIRAKQEDPGYSVFIEPNITRSINRFKVARSLKGDLEEYDTHIIYRPILFSTPQQKTWLSIEDILKSIQKTTLYLLDSEHIPEVQNITSGDGFDDKHLIKVATLPFSISDEPTIE